MTEHSLLLLEYEIHDGKFHFRAQDSLGVPIEIGSDKVQEQTPQSIFSSGFEILKKFVQDNLTPNSSLYNVHNDAIVLREANADSYHKFVDFGALLGGFRYSGQTARPVWLNAVVLGLTKQGHKIYEDRRRETLERYQRLRLEQEAKQESERIWYKGQRNSLSEGVLREEVDKMVKSSLFGHIHKSEIHECAQEIMRREKLGKRRIEYPNGETTYYPQKLLNSFVSDELKNRGFRNCGNRHYFKAKQETKLDSS